MKPTTDSINDAFGLICDIAHKAAAARDRLAMATAFFKADASANCVAQLKLARGQIILLRRTQLASIRHIDTALQSAGGTVPSSDTSDQSDLPPEANEPIITR